MIEMEVNAGPNDLKFHGRYENVGDLWFLREWWLCFHLPESKSRTVSSVHKIHKNQKKDIGPLKLVRWTKPEGIEI